MELKKIILVGCSIVLILAGTPVRALDYPHYESVLSQYVKGGYFDYENYMGDTEAKRQLTRYIKRMETVNPAELNKRERLAFWINLYNGATLKLIQKHYPLESIRDIGGWFSGPWEIDFITVNERRLTLDQIEHEIIRVEFDEPRIHYALVCAAKSCPPLRWEPYNGSRLDDQLTQQARMFLRSSKNTVSVTDGILQVNLSRIFSWYGKDFGSEREMLSSLLTHLPGEYDEYLKDENYTLDYYQYDWALNQSPGPYPKPTE